MRRRRAHNICAGRSKKIRTSGNSVPLSAFRYHWADSFKTMWSRSVRRGVAKRSLPEAQFTGGRLWNVRWQSGVFPRDQPPDLEQGILRSPQAEMIAQCRPLIVGAEQAALLQN